MKKAEQDVKDYQARLKSADEQKRRTALLAAKQEIIAEVIESAYQKFCSMEPGEYFETIRKMIGTYVLPQEGKILFSEKDLARMPESFPVELARIADERGGKLLFPKRREAWKADSSFCIMESKRTAHSEQSLTQRGMSFRTGYTRYYFFKTAQFREKEDVINGKKSIHLCGCADQGDGSIAVFPGGHRPASCLQR